MAKCPNCGTEAPKSEKKVEIVFSTFCVNQFSFMVSGLFSDLMGNNEGGFGNCCSSLALLIFWIAL